MIFIIIVNYYLLMSYFYDIVTFSPVLVARIEFCYSKNNM